MHVQKRPANVDFINSSLEKLSAALLHCSDRIQSYDKCLTDRQTYMYIPVTQDCIDVYILITGKNTTSQTTLTSSHIEYVKAVSAEGCESITNLFVVQASIEFSVWLYCSISLFIKYSITLLNITTRDTSIIFPTTNRKVCHLNREIGPVSERRNKRATSGTENTKKQSAYLVLCGTWKRMQ